MKRALIPFILFLAVPGCATKPVETHNHEGALTAAVLAKLHFPSKTPKFYPDETGTLKLFDSVKQQELTLLYLVGGAPATIQGAVGIFTKSGELLSTKAIESLSDVLEKPGTVFSPNDSAIFQLLTCYGTGFREETLCVFVLKNGELTEVFRCAGDSLAQHGEIYESAVNLSFRPSGNLASDIVRIVEEWRYNSDDEWAVGKLSGGMKTIEVYRYDKIKGYQLHSKNTEEPKRP